MPKNKCHGKAAPPLWNTAYGWDIGRELRVEASGKDGGPDFPFYAGGSAFSGQKVSKISSFSLKFLLHLKVKYDSITIRNDIDETGKGNGGDHGSCVKMAAKCQIPF